MSWSINYIGKPENIAKAIESHSEGPPDNQCEREWQQAKPHILGIVRLNHGDGNNIVLVQASGHGTFVDGKCTSSNCQVSVEYPYGVV